MNLLIYIISFLEGFTTLSVEIVALRKFMPIIGANSISTSIVLGVILLALSYGYYIGGKMSASGKNIPQKLVKNLLLAASYYFFISFLFLEFVLEVLLSSTGSYFGSILLSSVILFFIPVFLASQTIPLLSELLKGNTSGEKMGKLLFYSTVGSFFGAVGTSSFLFPIFGVYKTGVLSSVFLTVCALMVSLMYLMKSKAYYFVVALLLVFLSSFFVKLNNNYIIFEKANSYQNITIYDHGDRRVFSLDGAYSSGIYKANKKSFFKYILEAEDQVKQIQAKNILVIGAAGFTFPNDISEYDFVENVDVIDIDGSLKEIAETYFLEKKLSDKVHFYPQPSRFFVNQIHEKKYDFILVDAYSGKSLPHQILTLEFFQQLNKIGENVYFNFIIDNNMESDFSKALFSTLVEGFGDIYFKRLRPNSLGVANVMVTNNSTQDYDKYLGQIIDVYTDDKSSFELDIFKLNQQYY